MIYLSKYYIIIIFESVTKFGILHNSSKRSLIKGIENLLLTARD